MENNECNKLSTCEKIYLVERLKELIDSVNYDKEIDNQEKAILIAILDQNVLKYADLFTQHGEHNINFCLSLRKKLKIL